MNVAVQYKLPGAERAASDIPESTTANMNAKILLLVCLAVAVTAESVESGEYNFNWAVNHEDSDNDFGHQEARNGDDTQGSYYVQLPDGRLQTVRYVVDGDDGYVAEVSYEGEARFPDSDESK
ncbi:pro-resilin-like [Penaeus vannamei]|uniref:pro-resilin-like n=1 Tax=Penaeus vannamei TaxID=6689 RepID=UPI00387FA8E1